MPTPDESKILKIIEAKGGECTVGKIAIKIASNGWTALGKKPQRGSDGLKRYLEDRAKLRISAHYAYVICKGLERNRRV